MDASDLFTQHKMVLTHKFDDIRLNDGVHSSAGYECANCGERKVIDKSPDGIYYGSKTTVVGPGHDITEQAPADFNAWCPSAPQSRPEHFDKGTKEGK
jgi:hypothetical protein